MRVSINRRAQISFQYTTVLLTVTPKTGPLIFGNLQICCSQPKPGDHPWEGSGVVGWGSEICGAHISARLS